MPPVRRPILSLLLLAALSNQAEETEHRVRFVPTRGNLPVANARVCLFAGVYSPNPIVTMGQTDRVDCFDAADAIAIPPGLWHAYTHAGAQLISAQPDILIYEGHANTYQEVSVDLVPAAKLDLTEVRAGLGANEHLAVWIANTALPALPSVIRPLPRGSNEVSVPAGETVLPIVLNHGTLVSVGDPVSIRAGDTRRLHPWTHKGTTLVVWIKMGTENESLTDATRLLPPRVIYRTARGAEYEPLVLREGPSLELDLAVFRNVPPGEGTVLLSGETWRTHEIPVRIPPNERLVVLPDRLIAATAASLRVRIPIAITAAPECPFSPAFILRTCTAASCNTLEDRPAPELSTVFAGLAPGAYEIELHAPPLAPVRWRGVAVTGVQDVTLPGTGFTTVQGYVRRGDTPVAATVTFTTGGGVTDATGRYTAVLSGPPGREPVHVQFCDGAQEYEALPDQAIGAIYDIVMPDTRVEVTVRTSDGRPVPDAGVTATIFADATTTQVARNIEASRTNREGVSTVLALPPQETIRICASHPDFARRCSAAIVLKDPTAQDALTVTLPASRKTKFGRVMVDGRVTGGVLWWTSPRGVSEQTPVEEDGGFHVQGEHEPDEYVVFSSATHPLAAGLLTTNPSGEWELRMEGMRVPISVAIAAVGRPTHYLGLIIDGFPIPSTALDQHASFRGVAPMILQGASVTIPAVVVRQRATVVLGPAPHELGKGLTDWILDPARTAMYQTQSGSPPTIRVNF